MDCLQVKVKTRPAIITIVLTLYFVCIVRAYNTAYVSDTDTLGIRRSDVVTLGHAGHMHMRRRRDVPTNATTETIEAVSVNVTSANDANATQANPSDDINRTTKLTSVPSSSPKAVVTHTNLLGFNGTGIRRTDVTENTPKVSEPIPANDDNLTETMFKNVTNTNDLKYMQDNHDFYNSYFIVNQTLFNEHWTNITKPKANVHAILSNSHRRATTLKLNFDFPFYGHGLRNITVATGGFIYTGEHVHNWLAATQYIAPLMANFDTTIANDSFVKLFDDGEKFTALWENVNLQEERDKKFTFAVTLFKCGDIVFAYKDIPMPIQNIVDKDHPVKIGISDAYLTDRILYYVRRKTIYEYHRVSFKNYEITNGTILKLVALPTCLQYESCESCVNHNTGFNCSWCPQLQKCSSGTDRNKQDWTLRHCEKAPVTNVSQCAANDTDATQGGTVYVTDNQGVPYHGAVIIGEPVGNGTTHPQQSHKSEVGANPPMREPVAGVVEARSPLGEVAAALIALTLVCAAGAWVLYAFKNPHTRSGQMLIKYRPSQWSWRRGEARYTAATIHM